MTKNEQDDVGKQAGSYGKYIGIAFQMIAIIGIMAFAGHKIDAATGHQTQWVTAAMSLGGVFISLYLVIRSVKS